jgi:LacI family gluconate utilization system Gnt-I transcriptional repressor
MAVGYSSSAAAAAMVRRLLGRGYRRIGYLHSTIGDNDRLRDRLAGAREALAGADAYDPGLVVETRLDLRAGAAALRELVLRRPDVEAVFCASDVIAVGAVLECARQGWAVPGRLAIAGFDDLPIAAELDPPLTTIRVPRRAMGRLAAQLLLRRLAGETVEASVVDLGFELVARASA